MLVFMPNFKQDSIAKEYCDLPLEARMEAVVRRHMLTSATDILSRSARETRNISLIVLESVAQMRYALTLVAELLHLRVSEQRQDSASHSQTLHGCIASSLIDEARYMYTMPCNGHAVYYLFCLTKGTPVLTQE